jgi:hypothetical protein
VVEYQSKKKGERIMKSHLILAVSLLAALPATTGFASAQYYHARTKPIKVDYNFEVRNGGHAPIYYRYALQNVTIGPLLPPVINPDTPWRVLDNKNGFNSTVDGTLILQLSADKDGANPTMLIFRAQASLGPRSRGPRTCFITARVVHPEMKIVVTPQNISEYGRKTGQAMSEHRLPLDRNLTMEELNKYVIIPADKAAEYMAPRPAATPTVEQRTEPASEHEEEVTPLVRRQHGALAQELGLDKPLE